MTREEAIMTLKVVDENATCDDCLYYNQMEDCPNDEDCIIKQALDMAIKALEQEPCEDCINRDMALEKMSDYVASGYANSVEDFEEYSKIICQLPSVQPKTVSIPEGATNGDAVQIMFNKTFPKTIILYKNDESRLTINPMFSREWWEMPYKKSEDKG